MSINVFLKGDVTRLPGYVCKPWGYKGQSGENNSISGVTLLRDKGRWYIMLHEPTDQMPMAVADIVEEISLYDYIPASPKREAGIYRHESAEAEVQLFFDGKNNRNQVRIKAKEMEDVLELFRRIKIGSIRPEESYEGEQNGMSRAELEDKLSLLKDALQQAEASFGSVCERYVNLRENLRAFVRALREEGLPFCTKGRVTERINEILDSHGGRED